MAYDEEGKDKEGRVGLDAPRVRKADAITLMIHHLALAAMYFEATPDDISDSITELHDTFNDYEGNPKNKAAVAWLTTINEGYEAMKKDD